MSPKKKPVDRDSSPADASDGAQSAAQRQSAEAEVRELIARYAPEHGRLIDATRLWLQDRLPTAHEIVYEYQGFFVISYSPDHRGYEGALGIRASSEGVKLFLNQGKDLPDPARLLHGSGKQVRSMNLESSSTLARPEVITLVDEAIARNRVPFADAGVGTLTIRPTSARKRREDNQA